MKNSYPTSCICVAISAGLYGKTTRRAPVASRMLFQFRALLLAFGLTMGLCFALHAQTATDPDNSKVDNDGDGLIEIWNLEQLDHMRYNLAGTSYKTSAEASGDTRGCGKGTLAEGGAANKCHGYELMVDFDFADTSATGYNEDWDPVVQRAKETPSVGWAPIPNFQGRFEGNGHTISNLYVNLKSSAERVDIYAGLFGAVNNAVLRNLGISGEHTKVSATATHRYADPYAGGLAGYVGRDAEIRNCYATGDVSASSSARYSYNSLYSVGNSGHSYAGGLIGAGYGKISNSYATGKVSAVSLDKSAYSGGLVGFGTKTTLIRDSYATGAVRSSSSSAMVYLGPTDGGIAFSSSAGGLVGEWVSRRDVFDVSGVPLALSNCYATGSVSATALNGAQAFAGGLAAIVFNGSLSNCYATGVVSCSSASDSRTADSYTGGLVGSFGGVRGVAMTNCYATGDASASSSSSSHYSWSLAGGLIGSGRGTITNCYATGNVSSSSTSGSSSRAGGLVGSGGRNSAITNCYVTGDVTSTAADASKAHAGGVTGDGTATNCYYSGSVQKGTSSSLTDVAQVEGQYKTETQLKALTAATSGGWSELNWDFGTTEQLPMLRRYKEDGSGNQVQGELLGGQTVSIGERVAALERLIGGATQSAAADGSVYQRLKQLMAEVEAVRSSIPATPDLSVYALKRDLDAVERRLSTLATDSNGEVTVDLNAYALKTELLGKADAGASYTKQESDDKYALKSELPAAPDLSGYALKSELPEEPDLSGYALKSELPTVPDLSGYALKSELPAAPDLSSKANVGASYTRAESDRKEAALKADLEAEIGALRKALEDLKKQGAGTDASARTTAWLETRIVVRPNPVRDRLIVSSPVSVVATILDSSGQLLLTRQLPRGEQSVDVSGLSSGNYLLVLQAEGGETSTYKFVKE